MAQMYPGESSGSGLGNVTLTGTPSSGQVPVATSATAATWQTLSGSGTVTSVAGSGLITGGPVTGSGTLNVAGSGSTTTAATATSGVAGAATGLVLTTDGLGNVQPSSTLLSALETNAAAIAAFSGIGSCTNKAVTAVNANAVPTCTTITSAYVDSSIAPTLSPTFTGTPVGPTASIDAGSTQLATTAYVDRMKTRSISFQFGTPGGSAISTGVLGYATVPFACSITGWSIAVDAGTATVKTLKVAAGTAIPTLGSNSISTSGVSIASGTVLQSTTLTDFTSSTVTANDIIAADLITTSGVGYIDFQLVCAQ